MKNALLTTLALFFFFNQSYSQDETVKKIIDKYTKKDTNALVSPITINEIARNDFNKIQTGTKFVKTSGRFASIDINKNQKRFSFSPYSIEYGSTQYAVNFTGSLNSSGNFDFRSRKSLGVGLVFTKYFSMSFYKNKPKEKVYQELYEKIEKKVDSLRKNKNKILDDIVLEEEQSKEISGEKLKGLVKKNIIKYETLLADGVWTGQQFFWFTLNLKPLNNDNFHYIINGDEESYKKPYSKTINMLEFNASLNFFKETENFIINPALNIQLSNKHNLSELYSTSVWNSISSLTGTTFLDAGTQDVYVLDNDKFHQLVLLDWGIEAVVLFKKMNLGIDFGYDSTRFIRPQTTNSVSQIQDFRFGIVLPFKNAKGNYGINIVPFIQHKQFIDYVRESETNYGIKFNVPLSFN